MIFEVKSTSTTPSVSTELRSNTTKGRADSSRDRRSQSLWLNSLDDQVNRQEHFEAIVVLELSNEMKNTIISPHNNSWRWLMPSKRQWRHPRLTKTTNESARGCDREEVWHPANTLRAKKNETRSRVKDDLPFRPKFKMYYKELLATEVPPKVW